jgi:predicted alpha/beta superfamily hydrolase
VRSIARRLADHGHGLEEFFLVGLGYAKGDTPEYSRRRDYTPTANGDKDATSDMPGKPPVYGQAEAYRRFIANEVFPFLARNYRLDMTRKIYAGGSYGGLLGAQILLSAPDMFEAYILISPSLWFDRKLTLTTEKEYAANHRDLPAKVFLAVGAFETIHPGSPDLRYNHSIDLVRDTLALQTQLKSRRYPGLTVQSEILPEENHLTVYPAAITRGLLWALLPARADADEPLLQHSAGSEP